MNESVYYSGRKKTFFLGRNGVGKCIGYHILKCEKDIVFAPITSKGHVGRCEIAIPKEEIDYLIKTLNVFSNLYKEEDNE